MPEKVGTVRCIVVTEFPRSQINEALNMHHYGLPYCNKVVGNEIVPIEHVNRAALEAAQNGICEHVAIRIEADVMSDGTYGEMRIVK